MIFVVCTMFSECWPWIFNRSRVKNVKFDKSISFLRAVRWHSLECLLFVTRLPRQSPAYVSRAQSEGYFWPDSFSDSEDSVKNIMSSLESPYKSINYIQNRLALNFKSVFYIDDNMTALIYLQHFVAIQQLSYPISKATNSSFVNQIMKIVLL